MKTVRNLSVRLGKPICWTGPIIAVAPVFMLYAFPAHADVASVELEPQLTTFPSGLADTGCGLLASETFSCGFSMTGLEPAIATVSNGQSPSIVDAYGLTVTLDGTATFAGPSDFSATPSVFSAAGFGQRANDEYHAPVDDDDTSDIPGFVNGGPVTLTNQADLTVSGMLASNIEVIANPAVNAQGETSGDQFTYVAKGGGAIMAYSQGAQGYVYGTKSTSDLNYDGGQGGDVEIDQFGTLNLTGDGTYTYYQYDVEATVNPVVQIPVALNAVAGYSLGGDGIADKNHNIDHAGTGGDGGSVTLANTGTIVLRNTSTTTQIVDSKPVITNGLFALSMGGIGSNRTTWKVAGAGNGGDVSANNGGDISVWGPAAIGISANSFGGSTNFFTDILTANDDSSWAGNGGTVSVSLGKGSTVTVGGGHGIGVLAFSAGGQANNNGVGTGGTAGVAINQDATVDTTATNDSLSFGVLAVSAGSIGQVAPSMVQPVSLAHSGYAGAATVNNAGTIATTGSLSVGIAALSIGGSSIVTNGSGSGNTLGNDGGSVAADYGGAAATITNTGTVTTYGTSAHGLLAQSVGGGGGLLNAVEEGSQVVLGTVTQSTDDTAAGGNGGTVSVVNAGTVITGKPDDLNSGEVSIGIVAQSIGGGGGAAQGVGIIGAKGGTGGGDGGTVSVVTKAASSVSTADDQSIGILAQSIGGGGGQAGNTWGIVAAVGGAGGYGGNAGDVTVNLGDVGSTDQSPDGSILTAGDFAAGTVAQSIGGGGGNGGFGKSFGVTISSAMGGSGGDGGDGGKVTALIDNAIVTQGNQSWGVVAQSIGGGGGTGGAAQGFSASVISIAMSMGGSGGKGGDGSSVEVDNHNTILTGCDSAESCSLAYKGTALDGADSVGILAQSIGGGGGSGGSAASKTLGLPAEDIPTITIDYASGGSGGDGGSGGAITLNNYGTVATAGDTSHGMMAQSIGAGGGNAGDSTAASYAVSGEMPTIQASVAIGGTGGAAGDGGDIVVANGISDECPDCTGVIATYGNTATGILLQSIGGGGGTGGTGDATVNGGSENDDAGKAFGLTAAVGGNGGGGGSGGSITLSNGAGSSIVTMGSASFGILAQSIGGGGGLASGGTTDAKGDNLAVSLNMTVGGDGGAGNTGGTVTITNAGTIQTGGVVENADGTHRTIGSDAVAILAQSIGGGGGIAGDSDASSAVSSDDDDEDEDSSKDDSDSSSWSDYSYSATLNIGGSGGDGADGGTVEVTNTGSIQTYGHRAIGIQAQSVGGGGGNAGAATSTLDGDDGEDDDDDGGDSKDDDKSSGTLSADVTIGGDAGNGSNGGAVTVDNQGGTIATAGYGAFGILAQSIGGGGGYASEGTVDNTSKFHIGVVDNGTDGNRGNGGNVDVQDSGTILTAGDDAPAIIAQSIGGGGGLGTAGCTNSASSASTDVVASTCYGNTSSSDDSDSSTDNGVSVADWTDLSDITVTLGGNTGSTESGSGGTVIVEKSAGSIVTTGSRSMGIVAQTIGGSGGFMSASSKNLQSSSATTTTGTSTTEELELALKADASITTHGDGAWGILAQSIASGGGFAGDPSLDIDMQNVASRALSTAAVKSPSVPSAQTIGVDGDITTYGTNAHGVVAQSSGTGGSGFTQNNGKLVMGSQGSGSASGYGGSVFVTQNTESRIVTYGMNSIGILAQSTVATDTASGIDYSNQISMMIDGTVIGGTGADGTGLWVSGGTDGTRYDQNGTAAPINIIKIGDRGLVSTQDGVGGRAIYATDGSVDLVNSGTVSGSVELGPKGDFTNESSGQLFSGNYIQAASFTNGGYWSIGDTTGTPTYTSLSLGAQGLILDADSVLAIEIDSRLTDQPSDMIWLDGNAQVDFGGTISPLAAALMPGDYKFIEAQDGTLTGNNLGALSVERSIVFDWDIVPAESSVAITPNADFKPAGTTLSTNQASVADYLQLTWDRGGEGALAPLYGGLSAADVTAADYQQVLSQLSGETTAFQAQEQALAARKGLDSAFSCPVFEGDSTLIVQTSCFWAKAQGSSTRQGTRDGIQGYSLKDYGYRIGGQGEIAPDWFLGANLAYVTTSVHPDAGLSNSHGDRVEGAIALKKVQGQWYFGLGAHFGYGQYDNLRTVNVLGKTQTMSSETNVATTGLRFRLQYEQPFANWFLRPRADFDVIRTSIPGYSEKGPDGLALTVDDQTETILSFAPAVEVGGRVNYSDDWVLRPYASAGMAWMSNDVWTTQARIKGVSADAGSFQVKSDVPNLIGQLELGLEVLRLDRFEGQFTYQHDFGQDYRSDSIELRIAYNF
ncbi:autotransporter outer membrane beta-barrel domain-containing protein [Chachezhania sediminis]|uniref:autotransporter outer membrane beta-barrel domain-containing protein n=1 Tax=Chachezhania sediminis TaxID=2599291 RepID=UPI00131AD09E|nr:autotransporter outer membrane beta-barrel domain-containing protein [Chachezhania sediminis]